MFFRHLLFEHGKNLVNKTVFKYFIPELEIKRLEAIAISTIRKNPKLDQIHQDSCKFMTSTKTLTLRI